MVISCGADTKPIFEQSCDKQISVTIYCSLYIQHEMGHKPRYTGVYSLYIRMFSLIFAVLQKQALARLNLKR